MLGMKRKGFLGFAAVLASGAMMMALVTIPSASATPKRVPPDQATVSLPRNETVYSSGTMYSPPTVFNPNMQGSFATGTEGFLYETLFLYDPIHNKYIDWLAQSGKWVNSTTYDLTIRNNILWSDGTPMTAKDVAFTILLSKTDPGIYYSSLGADIKSVAVTGTDSLVVHFTHPAAEDWQSFLYQDPILPQHIMGTWTNTELNTDPNATSPVGSGPMTLYATNSTEVVYKTDSTWWATKDLGLSFKFTYWVDTVNSSNGVELSDFLANEIDLSNNFLPGITTLISSPATSGGLSGKGGYGGLLSTYLPKAPYMLSANTVWLEPNLTKAPMNNLNFRRAVAYAINTTQIASVDYTNMVDPANPTGLMPSQSSYIDAAAVKSYGFSYNPTLAKAYLAKSTYKGQTVTIECPDGWTDWMAAIDLMVKDLAAVGIHAKAYFPSFSTRETDLEDAKYDFSLDNNASIAADPYSYFFREFRLPISKVQTATDNWERDDNPAAWALVKKLNTLPMSDKSARQAVFNQLETIELQTLPEIPLWYNGAWAQFNSSEWTNWPGASKVGDQYTPVMWAGWLGQMTTVLALAHISLK